jgi:hypothetical protein
VWNDATKDFEWNLREIESRKLYIKSVDADTKKVTLKYKGAISGQYAISMFSINAEQRLTILDELTITAGAKVTGISPTEGSLYGGTIVTITGENFSDLITDNPVIIGDAECVVFESTSTEIKC